MQQALHLPRGHRIAAIRRWRRADLGACDALEKHAVSGVLDHDKAALVRPVVELRPVRNPRNGSRLEDVA
eukprot:6215915-Prymnesium_polylepis.1